MNAGRQAERERNMRAALEVTATTPIYVDAPVDYPEKQLPFARKGDTKWAHLWSLDLDALHVFASRMGMARAWFQPRTHFPHYDVNVGKRRLALSLGATPKAIQAFLNEQKAAMKDEWALAQYVADTYGERLIPLDENYDFQRIAHDLDQLHVYSDRCTEALQMLVGNEGYIYHHDGGFMISIDPPFRGDRRG